MAGVDVNSIIERSIAMLSQDIDNLNYALRAGGPKDLDSYRRSGLVEAMKRRRRELRSKLLFSRLVPALRPR